MKNLVQAGTRSLTIVLIVMTAAACSQSSPTQETAAPATDTASGAEALPRQEAVDQKVARDNATAKAKPAARKQPPAPKAIPILANASFEEWADDAPTGWDHNLEPADIASGEFLNALDEAADGERSIRIRANGKRVVLSQQLNLNKNALGKTVNVESKIYGSVPEGLVMRLTYADGEEAKSMDAELTEAEGWSTIKIQGTIPETANPRSLRLLFIVREFVTGAAIIDDVKATVK